MKDHQWGGTSHVTSRKHGVLAVDDDAIVRRVLDAGLPKQGFAVWLAADGYEALEVYLRHREDIDVVLLDVRMPRPDGPQTLAALQELNPRIPCCFMSGDFGSYTEEKLRNLGAAAVVAKPFRLAEVGEALWELVAGAAWSPPTMTPAAMRMS